jgi:hypothetical protein
MTRWIIVGCCGLLIALVGHLVLHAPEAVCSPKGIRPWAETEYGRTFDPLRRVPIADLRSSPPPLLKVERTATDLKISYESADSDSTLSRSEIFPADVSGAVSLPDGNRLQLAGVAILLPSDVEWGKRRYASAVPPWIDPSTDQAIVPGPGTEWAGLEQPVPRSGPRLFLRVKKLGQAPIRWAWSQAFDARTHVQLNRVASYSTQGGDGSFYVDLRIWHQTPLRIGVNFAFGDPNRQVLRLVKGASVQFGSDAVAELIDVLPRRGASSEWGSEQTRTGVTSYSARYTGFPPVDGPPNQRVFVLQLWPPENQYLVETEPEAYLSSDSPGLASFTAENGDPRGTGAIRLLRYPRLGRVAFDLAKIPRLPEVRNLFDTPIPLTWMEPGSDAIQQACDALELSNRVFDIRLPDSNEPVRDTTPAKLLEAAKRLSGKQIYHDRSGSALTTRPPETWWEGMKEWWRTHRP